MKITPGSRIVGKSGKCLMVDSVDEDVIDCQGLKIHISAVVQVIPPALKVGDRVRFNGTFQDWGIEPGTILTAVEIEDDWVKVRTDARKPMNILSSLLEVV
jgi:hypothetical protein